MEGLERYVLPRSTLPFAGPPGNWQYSNVIVASPMGPIVYNKPRPGDYVNGRGGPIDGVISCVTNEGTALTGLAEPATTTTPVAQPETDAPASETASPSPQPETTGTPSATASPSTGASGTQSAEASSADKVTICHATGSEDNPYTLLTLAVNAIENSGHLQHTGPLYPQRGWGDVIPPVDGVTDGLNWPAGQTLLENGCAIVEPPEPPGLPEIGIPEKPVKPRPPIITVPPIQPPSPSPSPSGTPTPPVATATPEPSTSPSPSGTDTATPGATPEGTSDPTREPTSGPTDPGNVVDAITTYCTTGDKTALDTVPRLKEQTVDVLLTNGVSSVVITRPFVSLYCLAQAGSTPDEDLVSTGMNTRAMATASLLLIGLGLLLVPTALRRR